MEANSPRKLFVNLAVRDLTKSKEFFTKLGFEFNPQFTNDMAACLIINQNAYVMLLQEHFFTTFTTKEICDTDRCAEGLFALTCSNRAEVDEMVNQALAAGGSSAMEPMDQGFMYGWSFYDLDRHHWEVLWMDQEAMTSEPVPT